MTDTSVAALLDELNAKLETLRQVKDAKVAALERIAEAARAREG